LGKTQSGVQSGANTLYCVTPVITLYLKTTAKSRHHSAVPSVANVAAISNVAVQVFQQVHHHIFQQTTIMTAPFRTKHFQILPSTHLLMRLIGKTVHSQNGNLEIAMDDLQVFKPLLCMESEKFQVATKMFTQWGKNKAAQESAAC
jgi:hypothetical protein